MVKNRRLFVLVKGYSRSRIKRQIPLLLAKEKTTESITDPADETSAPIIHSFGMYWQRDLVVWRNAPKMYRKQQALSKPVDFGKQIGIYILYGHHTVVYVGRSIDRPLGKRMYEHHWPFR